MKKTTYEEPKAHPKTVRAEREFDKTSLRSSLHGRYVHRDYAAHWFRWQHALRFVKSGMRVLDVGCGPDQMLASVLRASLSYVPSLYVGVDMNRIEKKTGNNWARILDEFDFTRRWQELLRSSGLLDSPGAFDVVTCFEVIEHMPVARGLELLRGIRGCLKPDGVALLSTPVYNGKHMAANHVHEYQFGELRELVERAGLVVDRVVGTFMTSQNAKRCATPAQRALLDELHEKWFAWEVLSNFLAPLYPEKSSNCCWILRRKP